MPKQTYKIVTSQMQVEMVQADRVEIDEVTSRLNLYCEDSLVGSFAGYPSFSLVDPELEPVPETP